MSARKARIYRGDLLLGLSLWGEAMPPDGARLFGFEEVAVQLREELPKSSPKSPPAGGLPEVVGTPTEPVSSGLVCWRLSEREPRVAPSQAQEPEWYRDAEPFRPGEASTLGTARLPARLPPVPWARLWPLLKRLLGEQAETEHLDFERVVDGLARGACPARLPRQKAAFWAGTCRLVIDRHPELAPYWDDFRVLVDGLLALRGKAGLEVLYFEDGPGGWCRPWAGGPARPYRPAPGGVPVLVVSDLGCLRSDEGVTKAWLRFAAAQPHRPVALLPCGPLFWKECLANAWRVVFWDRARPPKLLQRPPSGTRRTQVEPGLMRLMALAAPALHLAPDLLRALRFLLPAHQLDTGHEALIWNHQQVQASTLEMVCTGEQLRKARAAFRALPRPLAETVIALIETFHVNEAMPVRALEQALAKDLLGEGGAHFDYMARFVRTYMADPAPRKAMEQWFQGITERQHPSMWSYPEMQAAWRLAVYPTLEDKQRVPAGLDPFEADWPRNPGEPRHWELVRAGEMLYVSQAGAQRNVTPVGTFTESSGEIYVEAEQGYQAFHLEEGSLLPLPRGAPLTLRTENERLRFSPTGKPLWAVAWGRDEEGLWARVADGDNTRKLLWWEPGPLKVEGQGRVHLSFGCWLDAAQWRDLHGHGLRCPSWSRALGVDEFGIYADFTFRQVVQRFRWLMPDEFLMGSPEEEADRSKNEKQHPVLLTRAHWMADTACTQALWQAVLGKNPSVFKGKDLPVEKVSWHDIQAFIAKLPDGFRLPDEAWWEYACRARTRGPFFFGETITTEQVNFDGNFPYGDGERGEYREKTVEVKALPANSWGLYQMHGNVWEWCMDWLGAYREGEIVDPKGPESGENRVLRGGGWVNDGRDVRSASRHGSGPSSAGRSTGFRLVSDQEAS